MPIEIINIELPAKGEDVQKLNSFLVGHSIISRHEKLIEREGVPYLVYIIEYSAVGNGGNVLAQTHKESAGAEDVWKRMTGEERTVFDRLRRCRRKLADEEHVKCYVIATNEQLGEMVFRKVANLAEMKGISGFGERRLERYGKQFLEALQGGDELSSGDKGESSISEASIVEGAGEGDAEISG